MPSDFSLWLKDQVAWDKKRCRAVEFRVAEQQPTEEERLRRIAAEDAAERAHREAMWAKVRADFKAKCDPEPTLPERLHKLAEEAIGLTDEQRQLIDDAADRLKWNEEDED